MDSQSKIYVIGISLVIGAWITLSALMFGSSVVCVLVVVAS